MATEREKLYDRAVYDGRFRVGDSADARRWVAAVIETAGWHDLERR